MSERQRQSQKGNSCGQEKSTTMAINWMNMRNSITENIKKLAAKMAHRVASTAVVSSVLTSNKFKVPLFNGPS